MTDNLEKYPPLPVEEVRVAIKALKGAGWSVTAEPGRFVDGSERPLFKVHFPGFTEIEGNKSLPFRKLWDFQLVAFAKEKLAGGHS